MIVKIERRRVKGRLRSSLQAFRHAMYLRVFEVEGGNEQVDCDCTCGITVDR